MAYYVGLDVSVKTTSVCIVDESGKTVKEHSLATEPEVIAAWLGKTGFTFERIGHEAGPMSSWLHEGLARTGLPVERRSREGVLGRSTARRTYGVRGGAAYADGTGGHAQQDGPQ